MVTSSLIVRRLVLLRHGKSSWRDLSLADTDRPLKKRGRRQSAEVAYALEAWGWEPDLIVSSHALRAQQTASLVKETLALDVEIVVTDSLYACRTWDVLQEIASLPDTAPTCLLVGHNPTWEDVVECLTGKEVKLRTADAALMTLDAPHWSAANRDAWTWVSRIGRDEPLS